MTLTHRAGSAFQIRYDRRRSREAGELLFIG